MKRLSAALAALGALALSTLGLSGCNVNLSPYAAQVNGSVISQQQMQDALSAIAGNAGYRCTIAAGGTSHVTGAGDGTYNAGFSAEVLSILIQDEVVRQELVRLKVPEPSYLAAIARSQLEVATTPASGCPGGTGAAVFAAFSPSYRAQLLAFQMDQDALSARLAGTSLLPSGLAAYEAAHQSEASIDCVSVLEVGTKKVATSLRSQLLRGASFAALARAHSIDQTTAPLGGAVGCIPDADFNAPLNTLIAGLTPGQVSSVVPFRTDWLLLLVTGRRAESSSQLISSLATKEQARLGAVIDGLIRSAKVAVDPRYGTWTRASAFPGSSPTAARRRRSCRIRAPTSVRPPRARGSPAHRRRRRPRARRS